METLALLASSSWFDMPDQDKAVMLQVGAEQSQETLSSWLYPAGMGLLKHLVVGYKSPVPSETIALYLRSGWGAGEKVTNLFLALSNQNKSSGKLSRKQNQVMGAVSGSNVHAVITVFAVIIQFFF